MDKRPGVTVGGVLRNWGLVFLGNFAGALTVAVHDGVRLHVRLHRPRPARWARRSPASAWRGRSATRATASAGWFTIFVRGMLCNWMVSTGVVGAMISTHVSGKVIAMWMPIMVFFFMTFEHSVVNMFLFPSALIMGGEFSITDYFIWNEIPTVLGNLVGGITFTGATLYSTHVRTAPARAAVRAGGAAEAERGRESLAAWLERRHSQHVRRLKISVGQYSDKGRKATNQDFHGAAFPAEPLLSSKGICVALADGISSSDVSQVASESAVKAFLEDYYCTSEAWSVAPPASGCWARPTRGSIRRRAAASSATTRTRATSARSAGWCSSPGPRTCSTPAMRASTAWRARSWSSSPRTIGCASPTRPAISAARSASASGWRSTTAPLPVERGDVFVFATDGVHEHASERAIVEAIREHGADLDAAARAIVSAAYESGSPDNLTVQLVRVDELPSRSAPEILEALPALPFPPEPAAADAVRRLSDRPRDPRQSPQPRLSRGRRARTAPRSPSRCRRWICGTTRPTCERFLLEEWIARRIDNPHVLRARPQTRKRKLPSIS